MINKIISWSINNRILILVGLFVIVTSGLYTLFKTPIDAIPDLSDVQVIVQTPYPGQAPQVVENQVTYPLATAMLAVPGARTVRGYSFFGDSYLYVIFKDGTNPYWARSRVLEYLNQVSDQLPSSAKPTLGPDATGVGWIYSYALTDPSGQHNLSQLTSLQNWFLKYELQTIPGVAEVATVGGMIKQYQIILHPDALRSYHLTLSAIKQAILKANHESGGSVVEMSEAEYMVRSNGYISSINDLKHIPLGLSKQGTPILLSDISDIRLGPQMRRGIAELNGKGEVVGGIIVMRHGGNALKTIEAVKHKLADLKQGLPKSVHLITTYDRSTLIKRAVTSLNIKLIEEFIVVMLVCLVFLFHLRSSLVILVSLPAGILCAFIIMYLQGINANIMSLGGIAIAIGAMVDAAIVMIENCHKHIELSPADASRWDIVTTAACEVGAPLFFSLLIIALSFLPVFALQAQEGRLFAPLAFTKTYAMAAAAGLSITLVPVLMGYFIRGKVFTEQKNPVNRLLVSLYRPVIRTVLQLPKTTILVCILIFTATLWPWLHLGSEFMPQMDEGDWMYMPSTLPGISIGKAKQLLQQTDKLIMSVPEVSQVFGKIGRAKTATDPAPLTMIESVIQLKPRSEWRKGMTPKKLQQELDHTVKIPGITNAWVMPIKTRIDMLSTGIKTPLGIKVSGDSLDKIEQISLQLERILKQIPNTTSVYADRSSGGRYITIHIDRKTAARFGLNIDDMQEVINHAIGGANITNTTEGRERYPINMRFPQSHRNSIEKIKNLPIVTPSGAQIPLSEVATVKIETGPAMIKSENARLTGFVLVDLKGDVGSYIQQAKILVKKELALPAGYSLTWSGQYEQMTRAKEQLTLLAPITILIIFLLLYLCFKSLPEALIIMATLPVAAVGGIWLLYFLHYQLSVAVGVGFIALSGVAVEIGVIMMIYLNLAIQKQQTLCSQELTKNDIKHAIIDGALLRIRPIIMTVLAIIAGLLPILLGSGTGIEVMQRIAAPMVGGMVSAMLLTLVLIPSIYWLWKTRKLSH